MKKRQLNSSIAFKVLLQMYFVVLRCRALTCFVKHDFCLIILDANMSAGDDHKLLKAMRTSKLTPILILSTQSGHSGRIHALQAGAHAYLGHPYSHEECMAQAHSLSLFEGILTLCDVSVKTPSYWAGTSHSLFISF
ncbi:MAG: response regulator [Clostridia bacterium]|nr:response regulator [Clostridia bacterium]